MHYCIICVWLNGGSLPLCLYFKWQGSIMERKPCKLYTKLLIQAVAITPVVKTICHGCLVANKPGKCYARDATYTTCKRLMNDDVGKRTEANAHHQHCLDSKASRKHRCIIALRKKVCSKIVVSNTLESCVLWGVLETQKFRDCDCIAADYINVGWPQLRLCIWCHDGTWETIWLHV